MYYRMIIKSRSLSEDQLTALKALSWSLGLVNLHAFHDEVFVEAGKFDKDAEDDATAIALIISAFGGADEVVIGDGDNESVVDFSEWLAGREVPRGY